MARPQTYDHLKSKKKPQTAKVSLCLDSDLSEEFEEAQRKVREARIRATASNVDDDTRTRLDRELEEAEQALEALRPAVEEATVVFKFKSIGRKKYEELVLAHPPTDEQVERSKKFASEAEARNGEDRLMHNPDTFPVALIAKASVEPKLTEDEVREMWDSDDWTGAELMTLFFTAQTPQMKRSQVDLGKG